MMFSAFMLSTLVSKQEKATNFAQTLILTMLFVDVLFSNTDFCLKLFYAEFSQKFFVIRVIVSIFEYIPAYSYCMCFGSCAIHASSRFEYNTISWEPGTKYTYDDFQATDVF
jgi:hypothetical protein